MGLSPKIVKLKDDIALFSQLDCSILISGETGTGKELVARTIYELSSRSDKKFVPVNCAALNEELVLNELFGHEKDAFTGASQVHRGLFETAEGGVVLLDEIGEMPLTTQAKILRVLQDKKLYRIGGTQEIPVDFRVLAATNRDLEKEVQENGFGRISSIGSMLPRSIFRRSGNDRKIFSCLFIISSANIPPPKMR